MFGDYIGYLIFNQIHHSNQQQTLHGDNRMQELLSGNYHPSQLQNLASQQYNNHHLLAGLQNNQALNQFGSIDIWYLNNRFEPCSTDWYKREWDIEFIREVRITATEFLRRLKDGFDGKFE